MCPMTHHVRAVLILAVCAVAYAELIRAFHWMSQPSDSGWYSGIAVIFALCLFVPVIVRAIWRGL